MQPNTYERAYALYLGDQRFRASLIPARNAAILRIRMGQFAAAQSMFEDLLDLCRANGYLDHEANFLVSLGSLAYKRGRLQESAGNYRAALAILEDTRATVPRNEATVGLAQVLSAVDSVAEALSLLKDQVSGGIAGLPPNQRFATNIELGRTLLLSGRPADAIRLLEPIPREAEELGFRSFELSAKIELSDAHEAIGESGRSLSILREAATLWEEERQVPVDMEWREQRGEIGSDISTRIASVMLGNTSAPIENRRISDAFDALQRFKARTLLERISRPGTPIPVLADRSVTVVELQSGLLKQGELLLDIYCGEDRSFLFAVTPDSLRVTILPGRSVLERRIDLLHELLRSAGGAASREAGKGATESMATWLFAGVSDLLASSTHLLLIPDGPLNRIPLSVLPVADSAGDRKPLIYSKTVMRYPSATLLARLRDKSALPPNDSISILAVAGSRGASGEELPGALREAAALEKRFRHVTLLAKVKARSGLRIFSGFDVLHFAAHTTIDDQNPWLSAIQTGPSGGRAIRAAEIAGLDLDARLVVLSGCESASGRILNGEGVLGLSTSFLGAGVPAVVATLWPVDDRATADLMLLFYENLADGDALGVALREAQVEIAGHPATEHPFFWAGIIVLGDASIRLPIERIEPDHGWAFILFTLLALLVILWLWKSRKNQSEVRRL